MKGGPNLGCVAIDWVAAARPSVGVMLASAVVNRLCRTAVATYTSPGDGIVADAGISAEIRTQMGVIEKFRRSSSFSWDHHPFHPISKVFQGEM
jgi:hypothetical protein